MLMAAVGTILGLLAGVMFGLALILEVWDSEATGVVKRDYIYLKLIK